MSNKNKISRPGFLLSVADLEKSKAFYMNVLEQTILEEHEGGMVCFESYICLQKNYAGIIEGSAIFAPRPTGAKIEMKTKPNNCQIGIEVEDVEHWAAKIKAVDGIELLHDIAEYNWGQRVFRFYDYDGHIIEIGEDLKVVVKRLHTQGFTVEQIVDKMGFPLEYVKQLLHT